MKLKTIICSIIALAAIGCVFSFLSQRGKDTIPYITLANIEALSQNEFGIGEKCTRPGTTANCYDSTGQWVAIRIVTVIEYIKTVSVQICDHAQVTDCPYGSSERKPRL